MVQLVVGEGEQADIEIHDMSIPLRLSLYRSEHVAEWGARQKDQDHPEACQEVQAAPEQVG
jgi:hypothetical protein